jgi:hypothetical protein
VRFGRLVAVASLVAVVFVGCDTPARINVDNKDDATYVAWVGNLGFIVPPNRAVELVVFGWGDPYRPGAVNLFDANCSLILGPTEPVYGTVYIDASGSARIVEDHPNGMNGPDDAEVTQFCASDVPGPSPSPS